MRTTLLVLASLCLPAVAAAQAPVASYVFPAGGQRGTAVKLRVGGLFLHQSCGFEMAGPGVKASAKLVRVPTVWFEGPILPLPDSQRQEDYPKDMAGNVLITADAPLGLRHWRLTTSQGATPAMKFMVGELPEVVEDEIDGEPILVRVTTPTTINGRIFPREDIDLWTFDAKKGQSFTCEVHAARLGSPLDARLEVRDPLGRRLAESDEQRGGDPILRFTAPADGEYQVRIQDARNLGSQSHVYRLTIAAGPHLDNVYPLGGKRGDTLKLAGFGQSMPKDPLEVAIPASAAAEFAHVFTVAGQRTNPITLDVDDLPELREETHAKSPVTFPAMLNGRIAAAGEIDTWTWTGRKGDSLVFELRAGRLGSKLDGVLAIVDALDKMLAKDEANAGQPDPVLNFTVPADGVYRVQVQDRFRSRGGPGFAYRLRVAAPPAPGFRLALAVDAVTLLRAGTAKLKIDAVRIGGFKDAIALQIDGLPAGVSVANLLIAANQTSVELNFKADAKAKIQTAHLRIVGVAKIGSEERRETASTKAQIDDVLLAVALPTPFVFKGEYEMGFAARGSVHKRKYKIERNGYDGSIEISLTDKQARHLQGVTGPTIIVPAGATEFTYTASLPPWMETGRTCRVCVMGVGVVKDHDGSEHRVVFTSVNQNEQLVAVVGPGQLALEADRTSFQASPGKTIEVPVRVKRGQGLQGEVKLTLDVPAHLRSLSAEPVVIAAGQDLGRLTIRCAGTLRGPFTKPLTLRATMRHHGDALTAEVTIDVQP